MDLTDDQFESLKIIFSSVVEKLKGLSKEELLNVSGGKLDADHIKNEVQVSSGIGGLVGLGLGGSLGGIFAIIDTVKKSKPEDSFIKNFTKIMGKTGLAVDVGAGTGAAIGGTEVVLSGLLKTR